MLSALTSADTLSSSILQMKWTRKMFEDKDIDQITCPPPLFGDFCHYAFLILQYIRHRMRYVSPQRKVTL